jgi:hypothetical protein
MKLKLCRLQLERAHTHTAHTQHSTSITLQPSSTMLNQSTRQKHQAQGHHQDKPQKRQKKKRAASKQQERDDKFDKEGKWKWHFEVARSLAPKYLRSQGGSSAPPAPPPRPTLDAAHAPPPQPQLPIPTSPVPRGPWHPWCNDDSTFIVIDTMCNVRNLQHILINCPVTVNSGKCGRHYAPTQWHT